MVDLRCCLIPLLALVSGCGSEAPPEPAATDDTPEHLRPLHGAEAIGLDGDDLIDRVQEVESLRQRQAEQVDEAASAP